MNSWVLFIAFVISLETYAQQDETNIVRTTESYIFTFKFDTIAYQSRKCHCYKTKKWGNKCLLLKGTIISIENYNDTNTYRSRETFSEIQYVLVRNSDQQFKKGKKYLIAADNSRSENYLLVQRILPNYKGQSKYITDWGYPSGLLRCYRTKFLSRTLRKLGFNTKLTDQNTTMDKEDEFLNYIRQWND